MANRAHRRRKLTVYRVTYRYRAAARLKDPSNAKRRIFAGIDSTSAVAVWLGLIGQVMRRLTEK